MTKTSPWFEGSNVVITGASPDFGETLAIAFARLGARLFLSSQHLHEAERTKQLVMRECPGAEVYAFAGDLCAPAELAALADAVGSRVSTVELLINNGSFWLPGTLADNAADDVASSITSTFTGAVVLARAFLPLLKRSAAGDIVNLVARCGWPHDRHSTSSETFSAAKEALSAFGHRIREEVRGSGVRVLQIYPPNFFNASILDDAQWNEQRGSDRDQLPTARNVMNAILFGLRQDRVCSIDEIVLSNARTDIL